MCAADPPLRTTGKNLRRAASGSSYTASRISRASHRTPRPSPGEASPSARSLYFGDATTSTKSASRIWRVIHSGQSCGSSAATRSIRASIPFARRNNHSSRARLRCSSLSWAYETNTCGMAGVTGEVAVSVGRFGASAICRGSPTRRPISPAPPPPVYETLPTTVDRILPFSGIAWPGPTSPGQTTRSGDSGSRQTYGEPVALPARNR